MLREVEVAGVGLTHFGNHMSRTLGSLASEAVRSALADARLAVRDIDYVTFANAAAGILSGQEMIRGQVALKQMGLHGQPIVNTENACASGGTAAHLAWLAVASGNADIALAVGAEKLFHADKALSFAAIQSGTDLELPSAEEDQPSGGSVMMAAYAAEARRYAARYQPIEAALAEIAVKNRRFAAANEYAQYRTEITVDDVQSSRVVAAPLRLLTCSPFTDGAAAVVFRAPEAARLRKRTVLVRSTNLVSYERGHSVVERAAQAAYQAADLGAGDIDIFQLHDACAFAEVQQYEQVGIAEPGFGAKAVLEGRTGHGGDSPVNTDGGLLSRGHALGATGLAQLAEVFTQLRGMAGARQITSATTGLCVNAGGWMGDDYASAVATILQLG